MHFYLSIVLLTIAKRMLTISKFVWSIRIKRCLSTIQNTGIINCPNQLIKKWTVKFNQSRVPEPQLSAEFIVQHVLNERNNEVYHGETGIQWNLSIIMTL